MRFPRGFFQVGFVILAVIFIVQPVSAWTFQDWTGPAAKADLKPGAPVSIGYTLSFTSWMTGSTFDSDHTLAMHTDIADPHWVVTMTEMIDDETPVTSGLATRDGANVRLDSWSLSFSRKQFDVDVTLTGKIPSLNQSQEIVLARVQEMDSDAAIVPGSLVQRTGQVSVPEPEPIAEPVVQTEETVLQVTMEPLTAVTTVAPVKKQTYSPGPDPILVCAMLFLLVIVMGLARRRK